MDDHFYSILTNREIYLPQFQPKFQAIHQYSAKTSIFDSLSLKKRLPGSQSHGKSGLDDAWSVMLHQYWVGLTFLPAKGDQELSNNLNNSSCASWFSKGVGIVVIIIKISNCLRSDNSLGMAVRLYKQYCQLKLRVLCVYIFSFSVSSKASKNWRNNNRNILIKNKTEK